MAVKYLYIKLYFFPHLKKTFHIFRSSNACKENDYYAGESDDKVQFMAEMDRLCEIMSLVELESLNKDLSEHGSDKDAGRTIFLDAVETLNERLDKEKMDMVTGGGSGAKGGASKGVAGAPEWSSDELSLLIKAVNLFPAGKGERKPCTINVMFYCYFFTGRHEPALGSGE